MAATTYPPGFIKKVRDRIARIIEAQSAYEVPAICRRYGLADGDSAESMNGKFKYVAKRLIELPNDSVVEVARTLAHDEGDDELLRLIASIESKPPPTTATGIQPPRRTYFAERNGRGSSGGKLDLKSIKTLFQAEFERWENEGYFQEHFGFYCVDADMIHGKLGPNIGARMLYSLGKDNLWPIAYQISGYSEDDFFSVIEYLFDHISKPTQGTMHSWNDCGMHWETFDGPAGQADFRLVINMLLARYKDGWELSPAGEITERAPEGTENLLSTTLPHDDANIQGRVQSAVTKFRRRQSTADDRRDAVRDLADVLEYLRPEAKKVLAKKDESALFDIANNFGIRHHNPAQLTDYDPAIWLSWMFYFYLATIHAVVRFIAKSKVDATSSRAPG